MPLAVKPDVAFSVGGIVGQQFRPPFQTDAVSDPQPKIVSVSPHARAITCGSPRRSPAPGDGSVQLGSL
jgi:hypothetical protein